MKSFKEMTEARYVTSADYKIGPSGRKVHKMKKVADDPVDVKDDDEDEKKEIKEGTVHTKKYSWGTMKHVEHGHDFSIPLHPEHHQPIHSLKDGESHKFKDETNKHWKATREGDKVHFHGDGPGNRGYKTTVSHDSLKESVELDEAIDKQDTRLMQLARLGLVDKDSVSQLRIAMSSLKAEKTLTVAQRTLLLNVTEELISLVTGDDMVFNRVKLDVQKESKDSDKDDVPFDGPYSKTPEKVKDKSGAVHTPQSRVRHLARIAINAQKKKAK